MRVGFAEGTEEFLRNGPSEFQTSATLLKILYYYVKNTLLLRRFDKSGRISPQLNSFLLCQPTCYISSVHSFLRPFLRYLQPIQSTGNLGLA